MSPVVHDLLRIGGIADLSAERPGWPAWVQGALLRAPWVVVRRGLHDGTHVPVGVRGATRDERCAAFVRADRILERTTPEQLAAPRSWRQSERRHAIPALAALEVIAPALDRSGVPWGPAGSVGFELASHTPTATERSDLDLVMRAPFAIAREHARTLVAFFAQCSVRIDARVETPHGAISLTEWTAGARPILLRTADGPRLTDDPWAPS